MSTAPYRFIDRRGTYHGSSNSLHEAATSHNERVTYTDLARDTQRNISDIGRRTLMTIGRKLFADFPALESTVLEQANLSVGTFLPQYYGADKAWGRLAESWLVNEWLPICDLRGWPYDGDTYLELHVISELRDGDMGTLLTETSQGYPMIQIIPGHRIRSPLGTKTAKVRFYQDKLFVDGIEVDKNRPYLYEDPIEFDALLCDGVILGPQGNPIAYRVCDDGYGYANYRDVSSRNLFLNFHPKWADQSRGIPNIGSGAWDWQDVKESRRFNLVAQKVAAAHYLIEYNETGERPSATRMLAEAIYSTDENGVKTLTTPEVQSVSGGIRYFRAGTGSKIESLASNQPGQNVQQYQSDVMRDALSGMEWSYIFGIDPSKAGGASLRIVVDRINRVLEKRRKSPAKSFKRILGYAITKAMKLGILPWNDEWFMWEFQGPARMTADKKYDSDVDVQEIEAGLSTRKISASRRGEYWEDLDKQREDETVSDIQAAQRIAKATGITWQEAMAQYRPPKASAPKVQTQPTDSSTAEQGAESKKSEKEETE